MKKPAKKPTTPKAITSALRAGGFSTKPPIKVTPPTTVKPSKAAVRKTAAAKARRQARVMPIPQEYKAALSGYGLGAAQKVIRRRGRYYTAAGAFQLKKHRLKIKTQVEVQNVMSWEPSDRKGWVVKVVNGVPQKRLARFADVNREQKRAWRAEKIRVVAEKTGLSKSKVREILKEIRASEASKLKRFKKTKKFKRLTSKERRRYTIARRVNAVFGALCDLLQVYGSPKTHQDDDTDE